MLHILEKSYLLSDCLCLLMPGDAVICIEEGVYASLNHQPDTDCLNQALVNHSFYALIEDISARGLNHHVHPAVNLLNYKGFVYLVMQHAVTQTWF